MVNLSTITYVSMLMSGYIRSPQYHGNLRVGIWMSYGVIPFSEAVLYVFSRLQLSSIRLNKQQRVT